MEHMCILGCLAGSDRNDRDRKLVHFTYLEDLEPPYKGVIVYLPTTMDIPVTNGYPKMMVGKCMDPLQRWLFLVSMLNFRMDP